MKEKSKALLAEFILVQAVTLLVLLVSPLILLLLVLFLLIIVPFIYLCDFKELVLDWNANRLWVKKYGNSN